MNKLRTTKYKPDEGVHNDYSLFDKISKRYSNVRFLRKSANRKEVPANSFTGSYDMNGRNSEDHKLEIGAPILISKTTIDTDSIIDTSLYRHSDCSQLQRNSDQSDSYHDANSSLDTQQSSFHSSASSSNDERNEERAYTKIITLPINSEVNNNGNFIGNRSKSATNLHKTELSVYLQRSPSMEISHHFTQPLTTTTATKNNAYSSYNGFRTVSKHSIESDNSFRNSRNSITVNGSVIDEEALDFDMKSASFQSLDARNIFLSIEELNEITRQINESEEFCSLDDNQLEYQIHRDNLKPCERRVTLLRNKNQKFLNITPKRDKLTNAWSGFKNWIGEEKGKIKEVVNKHAAMQRVGANSKPATTETTVDGVTIVNGTALQITQNVTEANNQQQSLAQEFGERNTNHSAARFGGADNQQRRVIGSDSNELNSLNRKSLHEIEVIYERKIIISSWFYFSF